MRRFQRRRRMVFEGLMTQFLLGLIPGLHQGMRSVRAGKVSHPLWEVGVKGAGSAGREVRQPGPLMCRLCSCSSLFWRVPWTAA